MSSFITEDGWFRPGKESRDMMEVFFNAGLMLRRDVPGATPAEYEYRLAPGVRLPSVEQPNTV